jgi:hypothetical protein
VKVRKKQRLWLKKSWIIIFTRDETFRKTLLGGV